MVNRLAEDTRVRGWLVPGVLATVLLGGCASLPIFKPDRPPPVEIVIPPVNATEPPAVAGPPVLPRPKPVTEAPLPTAGDFLGLSVDEVRHMIGKPTLLREDHKIQVWHYRNLDCTLFLFFYPKGAQGYRVDHVDAADTRPNPASQRGVPPSEARRQMLESCVASTLMSHGSRHL